MSASTGRLSLLIVLLSGLCFFTRLGSPRLWDRDEPRNARCAWEMAERGDWIVPTFNGQLRAHKPVLLYWLMMSAYAVFGVNEFAARFWSATLATGTVLITFQIGRRLFDASTAAWSALILATTLMFNVTAHAATPDSALIFFSTLALAMFVVGAPNDWTCGTEHAGSRKPLHPIGSSSIDWRWSCGAGLAMGAAVLAKGPVGFVLPVAVWALFVWAFSLPSAVRESRPAGRADAAENLIARAGRWLTTWLRPRLAGRHLLHSVTSWHPLTVTAAMLSVAVPWYLWVGVRTNGDWLREFFLEHNVARGMSPREGHGGSALFYYPIAILVGFFPWSALTIPAVIWVKRRRDNLSYDRRFGLLFSWVAVYVVSFSLAGTKLPNYVTPTYPALALMLGHFVAHWPTSLAAPARWWAHWSAATLIVVGLTLAIALPWLAHVYLPGEEWLGAIGLVLLAGGVSCERRFRRDELSAGLRQMAFTSLCFVVVLFGWVAPRVSRHQQISQLLATAARHDPQAPLATWNVHEPSWVFYAGQTLPLLTDQTPQETLQTLGRKRGFLITSGAHFERIRALIGPQAKIIDEVPYFLRNDDLLLIDTIGTTSAHSRVPTWRVPR